MNPLATMNWFQKILNQVDGHFIISILNDCRNDFKPCISFNNGASVYLGN
jgi:hypothetical protein